MRRRTSSARTVTDRLPTVGFSLITRGVAAIIASYARRNAPPQGSASPEIAPPGRIGGASGGAAAPSGRAVTPRGMLLLSLMAVLGIALASVSATAAPGQTTLTADAVEFASAQAVEVEATTSGPEDISPLAQRLVASLSSRGDRGPERSASEADPAAPAEAQEESAVSDQHSAVSDQQSALPTAAQPQPSQAAEPEAQLPGHPLRVGIQAGHWKNDELPAELAALRGSTGAAGTGWKEVDVNLDVARRVVALLAQAGVQADLIPATVPPDYKADAFVALHCDANANTTPSGYKAARATWSSIPTKDDALVGAIAGEYQSATELPPHPQTITQNMLQYYAFDHDLEHAVDPSTPAAILEMGFLTNPGDRALLTQQTDRAAAGIASGILKFLGKGT